MSSYKYNSGMQSAAQAYNASGYTGSSNNLSGSGNIKLVVPILHTCNNTSAAEWNQLETSMAEHGGKIYTYEPSRVYDNLNSAAGFTNVLGGNRHFPVNNYIINLSTRSLNPIIAPLKLTSLGYASYEIGNSINVEYIPLNATSNSGRVSVSLWDNGVPLIFNSTNVMDSTSVMLSLGGPVKHTFVSDRTYKLTNQDILTMNGENMLQKQEGWNRLYDGPCIKAVYLPNSDVSSTSNNIVGQLVITFTLKTSNYTTCPASYGVMEWSANGFKVGETEPSTPTPMLRLSLQQSGEHESTWNLGKNQILRASDFDEKKNTLKCKGDFRVVSFNGRTPAEYALYRNFSYKYASKLYGEEFASKADPYWSKVTVAGCEAYPDRLACQSSSSFISKLKSPYSKGEDRKIVDGMYLLAYDYQGKEFLFNKESEFVSELNDYSADCSLVKGYDPKNSVAQFKPFMVSDTFNLSSCVQGTGSKEIFKSDDMLLWYLPLAPRGAEALTGEFTGAILNQNILLSVACRDISKDLTKESPVTANIFNVQFDDKEELKQEEVVAATKSIHSKCPGLVDCILSSTVVKVPDELANMPELKDKYVKNRRDMILASSEDGFLASVFSTIKSGAAAVVRKVFDDNGSRNAPRYTNTRSTSSVRKMLENGPATRELLMGNEGDSGDAYFIIPEETGDRCKVRLTKDKVFPHSSLTDNFPELESFSKYYVENPGNTDNAYYIKINNTYEFCPGITLGVSNPVYRKVHKPLSGDDEYHWYTFNASDNDTTLRLLLPDVCSEIWPVLVGSRYPSSDPKCLTHCVPLTLPAQNFQTVKFNIDRTKGSHKNVTLKANTGPLKAELTINTIPLNFSNNININTGFYIPDKLPSDDGSLKELYPGDKIYIYILMKVHHRVSISGSFFEAYKEKLRAETTTTPFRDGYYINRSINALDGVATDKRRGYEDTDGLKQPLSYIFGVFGECQNILLSDGTASESTKPEEVPAKGVNHLIKTATSVQISKCGEI